MKVRLAGIVNDSIVDGPGIRLAVFFQGCPHHCRGCHNPDTHDPEGGVWQDTAEVLAMAAQNPLLDGVTLTGGEPFLQPQAMAELAESVRQKGLNVIAYTGFIYEVLLTEAQHRQVLNHIDYLVDGPFEEDRKSISLRFKGSANQRVIDVQRSLQRGTVVLAEL